MSGYLDHITRHGSEQFLFVCGVPSYLIDSREPTAEAMETLVNAWKSESCRVELDLGVPAIKVIALPWCDGDTYLCATAIGGVLIGVRDVIADRDPRAWRDRVECIADRVRERLQQHTARLSFTGVEVVLLQPR